MVVNLVTVGGFASGATLVFTRSLSHQARVVAEQIRTPQEVALAGQESWDPSHPLRCHSPGISESAISKRVSRSRA